MRAEGCVLSTTRVPDTSRKYRNHSIAVEAFAVAVNVRCIRRLSSYPRARMCWMRFGASVAPRAQGSPHLIDLYIECRHQRARSSALINTYMDQRRARQHCLRLSFSSLSSSSFQIPSTSAVPPTDNLAHRPHDELHPRLPALLHLPRSHLQPLPRAALHRDQERGRLPRAVRAPPTPAPPRAAPAPSPFALAGAPGHRVGRGPRKGARG